MTAEADFSSRTEQVARPGAIEDAGAQRASRTAWLVLWIAFANWCLLIAVCVGALLTFRATATEKQWAVIGISRGLASYQPNADAEPRLISRERVNLLDGATVQTGPNSRARIELFDGSVLELLSDTAVGLDVMRRGKFEPNGTALHLSLVRGAALLRVPGTLPSEQVQLSLDGTQAYLGAGDYLVWITPESGQISVYEGHARLVRRGEALALAGGQRALIGPHLPLGKALPLQENLLTNGDFSNGLQGWKPLDDLEVRSDTPGERKLVPVDTPAGERVALRVSRTTQVNRHNKTGVIQDVNRDVRGFRSLKLRAKVKLLSSTLDGGGYAGTEYPLMFVVYYVDDRGGEPNWVHGFYYKNVERRPIQFGELITRDEWHEYEVELMDQPDRPALIKSLWVFGAGHGFDAMVTDLELVAS